MLNTILKTVLCALLVSGALPGCSDESALRAPPSEKAREFGEQDKAAARALSIGNNEAMASADSPYAQALLCRHGIEVIADRLRQSGGFSDEQVQGIAQAQTYFDRRLRVLADSEGKSASDIRSDLAKTATDNPDIGVNARIAIACLQKLQQPD